MQESLTLFFDEYAPEMCYTLRKKQIIVKMTGEFAVCSDQLKVFVSYSHDDEKHKEWVYKLSCDLVKNGIDTILDQWDLKLGANLPVFMEQGLSNSDRVLVVCSDNYIAKSNSGTGGVGYEKNILTAELLQSQDSNKFIPIIRNVTGTLKAPICLAARLYTDFSNDDTYENSFKELLHEIYGILLKPKPELGKNPFIKKNEKLTQDSTIFFYDRFCSAFPGVRGCKWFDDPEIATKRLAILMKPPIKFDNQSPIWWWRTGDLHIDHFEITAESEILIDYQEFKIDKIAAVNAGSYYQTFVYIETKPHKQTGLYDQSNLEDKIKASDYVREEYAIFQGNPISREEYDDGATVIDGSPVQLEGDAKLRVRYITPYNLIIAPHNSPINNNRFDAKRKELLNNILKGDSKLEDFISQFLKLPKRQQYL